MIYKRVKSEGLAHLSYFIGSENDAVVIDPRRDCQIYADIANQEEVEIQYIFETHRNEDYVIGSLELADLTGADVYHGPWPDFQYGRPLTDGQIFNIGKLQVTAIHTPGHTPGCMSYAVADLASGDETVLVCTGDALFVNDVGRTDFGGLDKRGEWSENLYNSIFQKLLPLGDQAIMCPAHGSGSVCGANIAEREWSTLGLERRMNLLLQLSKEKFIERKVNEHHEVPPYFRKMEQYNLEGPPILRSLPEPSLLSPLEFQELMDNGAVVVDTRTPPAFGSAHINGSYSIWLGGLPSFAGWVLSHDQPILLVLKDRGHLESAVRYLFRIGYDMLEGYILGVEAWSAKALPLKHLGLLTIQELKARLDKGNDLTLLDVRTDEEWDSERIEGAIHMYVGHLEEHITEILTGQTTAVICSIGNRASLGASILQRKGYTDLHVVLGGMYAWQNAGYKVIYN
jgi:hydroxyacylglutathione hydrolase